LKAKGKGTKQENTQKERKKERNKGRKKERNKGRKKERKKSSSTTKAYAKKIQRLKKEGTEFAHAETHYKCQQTYS
jgi:hypothetical protein